jgi:YD repeat-containing protein
MRSKHFEHIVEAKCGYDAASNVLSYINSTAGFPSQSTTYGYDVLNQLTSETRAGYAGLLPMKTGIESSGLSTVSPRPTPTTMQTS